MKILAVSITDQKLPIEDIIKEHVSKDDPSNIDHQKFAVDILENAFNMKSRMTRNMIQLVLERYDDKFSTSFDYNIFINDLIALEQVYPTQVRIFKT